MATGEPGPSRRRNREANRTRSLMQHPLPPYQSAGPPPTGPGCLGKQPWSTPIGGLA